MKNRFTSLIVLFVLLIFVSSCGTTIYRARAYKTGKYINAKRRWHFWHAHGRRPHPHPDGRWY